MATSEEYESQARRWKWRDVRQKWADIREARPILGWDRGRAFEYVLLRAFQLEGAQVQWPFQSEGQASAIAEQIDGAVYCDGLSALVEAKDWTKGVPIDAVAKMRMKLERRPSHAVGLVFGREGFTDAAKELARYQSPLNILLWEGADIDFAIRGRLMRESLLAKFHYAVERAIPDVRLEQVLRR